MKILVPLVDGFVEVPYSVSLISRVVFEGSHTVQGEASAILRHATLQARPDHEDNYCGTRHIKKKGKLRPLTEPQIIT